MGATDSRADLQALDFVDFFLKGGSVSLQTLLHIFACFCPFFLSEQLKLSILEN
jgi:hypothetical protein